jgi:hypothetical protein
MIKVGAFCVKQKQRPFHITILCPFICSDQWILLGFSGQLWTIDNKKAS